MKKKIVVNECFHCPYRKSNPEINTVICTYETDKILKKMDWSLNGQLTTELLLFPRDCPLEDA